MHGSLTSLGLNLLVAVLGILITLVVFNRVASWTSGFPLRFHTYAHWPSGTLELKRISPLPAALMALLTGLFTGLIMGLGMAVVGLLFSRGRMPGDQLALMALVYPMGLGLYGGLVWLGLSPLYNVLARAWGGVQFEALAVEAPRGQGRPAEASGVARVNGVGAGQLAFMGGLLGLIVAVGLLIVVWVGLRHYAGSLGDLHTAALLVGRMLFLMLLLYPLVGLIMGGVCGCAYNLAGRITGGLEVEAVD